MMSAGAFATLEVTNLKGSLLGSTGGFLNDDLATLPKDEIDYLSEQIVDQAVDGAGSSQGLR